MKRVLLLTSCGIGYLIMSGATVKPKKQAIRISIIDSLDIYRIEHNRLLINDACIQREYAESYYQLKKLAK